MSTSNPPIAPQSRSPPQGPVAPSQSLKPLYSSTSDWLPALIFNAKAISAAGESLPFPYVKGVFGTAVFLLETVERVQKNRDSMRELCADTVDIITVLRDQISHHGDTAAIKFKSRCEELESFLQDIVESVNHRQIKPRGFSSRLKEVVRSSSTSDEISRYRNRIGELRSNFILMATMDTHFQVQKVLTVISPAEPVPEVHHYVNTCPPPTRIFHGRRTILDNMHSYFTRDIRKQHIFLLHGLGGAGKTQIALKFIEESVPQFADIFLIDTSTVGTIDTGLKNIATTKSVGDSSQVALEWLKSKKAEWLLFFDNADDPKIDLNKYFPQCSHGNIIITSRNPGLSVYTSAHCAVTDMEESDSVDLLFRSAAQNPMDHSKETAAQIVQTLCHLPLAIIQAGAFISKSGNLDSYLALYADNKARLLAEKPSQSHDNYAWTVYTTWKISFDQLSDKAKTFLKLCSFLHYQGISENIFKNATKYTFEHSGPSKEELEMPLQLLSQFLGPSGAWDPLCFLDIINEIRAYSLIYFDSGKNLYSIHPLVHEWTRSTLSDERYYYCMIAIAGMSVAGLSEEDIMLASLWMLPHIELLAKDNSNIIPDFRHEYGKIYLFAGKAKRAEELQVMVLEKRQDILGEDHPDTIEAMYWLAWTNERMGKFQQSVALGEIVLKKRKEILGESCPETLAAMGNLAVGYSDLAKFKEAEAIYISLLEQCKNLLGDDHLDTLSYMGNLALTYQKLGKFREAEELELLVLDKRRNIQGANHPDTLIIMGNLAIVYQSTGRAEEAKELEVLVIEKQRKILGDNHPATLKSTANLVAIYSGLGNLHEAEELGAVVLEKQRNVLGDSHPDTLLTQGSMAALYGELGRLQEAEVHGTRVLEKRKEILGINHPETLHSMLSLAFTYKQMGKFTKAEQLQHVVFERQKGILGNDHPHTLLTMGNLGATYNKLGRLQEAEEIEVVVLEKRRNVLGNNHPSTLRAMSNLGSTLSKLERLQEAEKILMETLKKQREFLSEKHPFTIDTMKNLAVTYTKLGKLKEAEDLNKMLQRL
ncbi:hypothetical protein FB451DRAFT_1494016 [Mycena latifolia]|nr:hypothetical protein FB451DRAFT_1494016 [Mycena latifolia]